MTELTGKQIASTYKQLLKIGVSTNTGVSTTLQTVQSGDGTNSALQIATGKVAVAGELSVSGDFSIGNLKVNKINVSTCISATNLVAATGSFTTKVSGVAGEFSGTVCAATFDGALTGDVTGDIDGAIGSFSACISATNLVAATGSFTTKVSGVAGEFSGTVCAATFDGALTGDVTGDIDGATGSFSACISATNLVAATGSFTTKVSGVAAEFSGNVCAAEFYGGGANITGITHPTSVAAMTINTLGVVTAASITSLVAPHGSFTTKVSGVDGEFSGTVCAATFDGALTGDVTGDLTGDVTGDLTGDVTGDITGDIDGAVGSFSACISVTNLVAETGSFTTKVSGVAGEFSGTVCAATFDGALTGDVTGDIDGATGSFSACISATNLVVATGSFTTKVSGVAAEFSGNVCASEYYGDGSNLTNLPSAPTSVASFTINQLGVVTAASITSLVAPHGSFTTKVSGVAAEFSGNVCASEYYGGGSNLTGISTSFTGIASNITPDGDGTRDIGTLSTGFKDIYQTLPPFIADMRMQSFTLWISNESGTLKHNFSNSQDILGSVTLLSTVAGSPGGSLTTTPTVDSSTAMASGGGILSSDTTSFVIDTINAQLDAGGALIFGIATIARGTIGTDNVYAVYRHNNSNINGTTKIRPIITFFTNTGGAWNINTTNIATSKSIGVQVLMGIA